VSPIFQFLFLLASFICFVVATFGARARWSSRVNLIGLGLALYIFVFLMGSLTALS
jgi:hypothetical protein